MKTLIGLVLLLAMASPCVATVAVDENFDDQSYSSPLRIYTWDAYDGSGAYAVPYSTTQAHGGSGYSIEGDHNHPGTSDLAMMYSDLEDHLDEGIYIRYWVFYPTAYTWPAEDGLFSNVKMAKFAGTSGWDIEFIYKGGSSGNGPTGLQLYWNRESTGAATGGTGTGSTPISLSKNAWHQIEMYLHIPAAGASTVHVAIDGVDAYHSTDADVRRPASAYTGTQQFISIRASNSPADGHDLMYYDDVYIAYGEGDLVGASQTLLTCYLDADGDGYSEGTYENAETCSANYYEAGDLTATSGDCDDTNAAIHPGAVEVCGNAVDEDCNGAAPGCAALTPATVGGVPLLVGGVPFGRTP